MTRKLAGIVAVHCLFLAAALGRVDPSDSNQFFRVKSIALDPATFIVTLVIPARYNPEPMTYGVLAHQGPPFTNVEPGGVGWTFVAQQTVVTNGDLTFVDDVSGSLQHEGRSYCGFISAGAGRLYTVTEEFVGYPFLTNPVVRIQEYTGDSNVVAVEYANGIYSNTVRTALSNDVSATFFRMWSPDNDPKHAHIQACTNRLGGIWTNCTVE